MADEIANGSADAANPPAQQFVLQKIYVKDSSFEAPNAPAVFQEEGAPQLQLNLAQKIGTLSEFDRSRNMTPTSAVHVQHGSIPSSEPRCLSPSHESHVNDSQAPSQPSSHAGLAAHVSHVALMAETGVAQVSQVCC